VRSAVRQVGFFGGEDGARRMNHRWLGNLPAEAKSFPAAIFVDTHRTTSVLPQTEATGKLRQLLQVCPAFLGKAGHLLGVCIQHHALAILEPDALTGGTAVEDAHADATRGQGRALTAKQIKRPHGFVKGHGTPPKATAKTASGGEPYGKQSETPGEARALCLCVIERQKALRIAQEALRLAHPGLIRLLPGKGSVWIGP